MAQMILSVFPEGVTQITPVLGFEKLEERVHYFNGTLPIFSHAEDDVKSFRLFVNQLVVDRNCKKMDIVRAFCIPPITMKRSVKFPREKGPKDFFEKRKFKPQPRVFTPEMIAKVQVLLNEGKHALK